MAEIQKLLDSEPYFHYPNEDNPTTEQQYQDFIKNMHNVVENVANSVRLWQPEATYAEGEVVSSPNMQPNTVAKVTTAGQTNNIEPTWTDVGTTVEDNGCVYLIIRKCQESATEAEAKAGTDSMKIITPAVLQAVLEAFKTDAIKYVRPIGSIFETTTNDDPNTLWPGTTWEKMAAGLVLVSAGTYTESGTTYTYTLGATGGEAKHKLTTGEMPSHTHSASGTTSTTGAHYHGGWGDRNQSAADNGVYNGNYNHYGSASTDKDSPLMRTTTDGNHNHKLSITIGSSGSSAYHENRMPYMVINRWKRTA